MRRCLFSKFTKSQLFPRNYPAEDAQVTSKAPYLTSFIFDISTMTHHTDEQKIPLLLLKTQSTPTDGYEEYFSTFDNGRYEPVFVPVLEHRFIEDSLAQVRARIISGGFTVKSNAGLKKYGAIIFTSQRAVEAFVKVVDDIYMQFQLGLEELLPATTPLYVVGPATARGLRALNLQSPILGEESGNGDALAAFILEHYNSLYNGSYPNGFAKPPLLFLVGEKRRDTIPKTLESAALPPERRLKVDELVIYETGEMPSFKSHFSLIWEDNRKRQLERQWVVVFSPTGCEALLDSLDLLDTETGKAKLHVDRCESKAKGTSIATIGPTTRDYLRNEFGFVPEVYATKPSPEGLGAAIKSFMEIDGLGSNLPVVSI